MLPKKMRKYLENKYGDLYQQFPKEQIINYFLRYDSRDNIEKMMKFSKNVVKIEINHPVSEKEIRMMSITDKKTIKNKLISDKSINYIDYMMIFEFFDSPIYDYIIKVMYHYLYD